jgi:hypothetical protein
MATQIQYRRGTNAQNAAFTGALAEITVDTTNGTLRVHDGLTAGGSNIATVAYVTSQISSLSSNSISFGTSSVAVIASGGNIRANVGGSTITNTYSSGLAVTGLISATGNITGGNLIVGSAGNAVMSMTGANLHITNNNASGNITLFTNFGGSGVVEIFKILGTGAQGVFTNGDMTLSGNITDTGPLGINTGSNGNLTY